MIGQLDVAAIQGTFSDYRLVKGRGVLQIVVEIPVEAQAQAFAALGYPEPGKDIHVAVARLQPIVASQDKPAERDAAGACLGGPDPGPPLSRPKTEGERARIRAVMLCQDQRFRRWSNMLWGENSADWLRGRLGIASRSELATNPAALKRFLALETRYLIETGQMAEPR